MKSKLTLLSLFVLLVQFSNAQVFGVKGGLNLANMSFSTSGMGFTPKSLLGFHVGPVAEIELQESLSFNTGLLFSLKGFKIKTGGVTATESLNYLEIPLNVAYKLNLNEQLDLFFQAGPYVAYALSGKDKSNGETSNIEFGDGGMKRLDFGLGFGAGLILGPIVPSISYQLGLANIVDDQDVTVKNKVLQFSVAYMFGK